MTDSPHRRAAPLLIAATCALLLACWLAGFVWFVQAAMEKGDQDPRADGIVVLTGGADRISAGVHLLQQGRARTMLISGVGHGAILQDLLRGTGVDWRALAPRIVLGRGATTTAGNADETANWVREEGLSSLIVVTAGYHMRRAMAELQHSLPGIVLHPFPVQPPALRQAGLAGRAAALWLLLHEYMKYLAARLGLARLTASTPLHLA